MDSSKTQKEIDNLQKVLNINEEDDVFIDYINKKIRNLNKKLEQITLLEQKTTEQLKPEQVEKITTKSLIAQDI